MAQWGCLQQHHRGHVIFKKSLFLTGMMSSSIALKCTYGSFFSLLKLPLGYYQSLCDSSLWDHFSQIQALSCLLERPCWLENSFGDQVLLLPSGRARPRALASACAHRVRLMLGGVGSLPLSDVRGPGQPPQHC